MDTPLATEPTARPPSVLTLVRRNFWLLFGGIFLVAGLLGTLIGLGMAWEESRFGSDGQRVQATVLGKSIEPGDADEGTRYHVHYRFGDPEGTVREGSDVVGFAEYDRAVEGGPIEIEFLASDPAANRVVGDDAIVVWISLGVGLAAAVFGAAVALPGWRAVRRARRLWSSGTPAVAEVTEVEETNVRFNQRQLWRVRYRYSDAAGRTHDGASDYLSFHEVRDFRPGDHGTVRYDAARPEESVWVGGRPTGG